jgi:hypothetical protein
MKPAIARIGDGRAQRRDAGPHQAGLHGAQGLGLDAQRPVARRHRVAAEHVDVELADQPLQHRLAALVLQVQRDRLLADVGRDEVAAAVVAAVGQLGQAAANVAVGVAGQAVARRGGLDADDAPAELREAQRRVRQRQRLFERQHGARLHRRLAVQLAAAAGGSGGTGRTGGSAPCSAR